MLMLVMMFQKALMLMKIVLKSINAIDDDDDDEPHFRLSLCKIK